MRKDGEGMGVSSCFYLDRLKVATSPKFVQDIRTDTRQKANSQQLPIAVLIIHPILTMGQQPT
jgi:hypothetical protein